MKKARFLIFLVVIQMILFISGCKWSIVSVTGPNCASTGETVTIYIEGTCESEGNSPTQYGLILQIPNSWLVLSATAKVGVRSYNLTENAEYASLYTAEPGQKIWVGTATQSSNSTENGIATVRLSIGDSDGQVKAVAGSYRNSAWTTDDPAGEFNFTNITEQKYVHSISTANTCIPALPPTVTSISPDSGSTNGGTEITVHGSDFAKGSVAGITIGGDWISYHNITYGADGTWLQLNTPIHVAGAVDVTVRNPDGQEDTLLSGYTYVAALPPSVTSVNPDSGSSNGGTEIIVYGSNFEKGGVAGITMGDNWISDYNITYAVDGTWLQLSTPAHAAGTVDVTVRNPDGQEGTLSSGYTYVADSPPTVTSVSPDSGSSNGGTEVTVYGTHFVDGSGARVIIGGDYIYSITYGADGTWLRFNTPAHPAGAVDVTVRNPDGQEDTLLSGYTYIADSPPSATSVSPTFGSSNGGTEVTVYGTNFVDGSGARVIIGGNGISYYNITYGTDGTWLRFDTPAHSAGAVDVTVRNPDGQEGTLSSGYTYIADSPPSATSVSPTFGSSNGGTEVTVYGTNFVDGSGARVIIGGNGISYYNITYGTDGTWLRFDTPAHSAGAVDVTVRNPDGQEGTLSSGYTYIADSPPTVTSVSPNSGPSNGGAEVTVHGTNFVDGRTTVYIGDNWVWSITYASDGTWLRFDTPAHAAGSVDVIVRNPDGQEGTLVDAYTYLSIPTVTTTAVSNIAYSSATSGGEVSGDGSSAVTKRGVCWSTAANPKTSDATTSDGEGTGTFTSLIKGLSPTIKYYVRAYATNSEGTAYGNEVSFTTSATIPTVTTKVVSAITTNSASSGGDISIDGGASVTAKGVCWSISPNPNIDDNATMDGQGTGSFISAMTGLKPGTIYHVRAYAINSAGTAYGSNISFETSHASTLFVSSDGNCGSKTPCYASIQGAIDDAVAGSAILVKQGAYEESVSLESAKTLLIKGGYNSTYDQQAANTTFIQAPGPTTIKASSGSLKFQMINVK